jgi:nitroreductase
MSARTSPTRCPRLTCSASPKRAGGLPRPVTASTGTSSWSQLEALSTVWRGARHIAGAAAAIALIIPQYDDDRTRLVSYYDLGQATYAIMVEAADLGVGTGHSSVGEQDKARSILGVPDDHDVAFLIGLGYPADRALRPIIKPDRRPFDEVVRRGHW